MTVLRVEVTERGQSALPAVDIADATFIIGSSPAAKIRLPATVAEPEHVRIANGRYSMADGTTGELGDGVTLTIGTYDIRIARAPAGSIASPPQRTESLARELLRNMLGTDASPTLEVEAGPVVGATRRLAPPESSLVIGRGDEAGWVLLEPDLSRTHADIRRGWDGTRVFDLDSKNGTRVDGTPVPHDGILLRTGARIELGPVVLRFRDPTDVHLAASAPVVAAPLDPAATRVSTIPFYGAITIMLLALAGLVWTLTLP